MEPHGLPLGWRSEGAFDLHEGTIYPALHRLEDAGLLGSSWAEAGGRKRRVYALTEKGVAALAAGRTAWRRFAAGMQARCAMSRRWSMATIPRSVPARSLSG